MKTKPANVRTLTIVEAIRESQRYGCNQHSWYRPLPCKSSVEAFARHIGKSENIPLSKEPGKRGLFVLDCKALDLGEFGLDFQNWQVCEFRRRKKKHG